MTADSDRERIVELELDNKRLRRLLEQKDAPGELRHRLRSTLSLLRSIVRKSAETPRDLPNYVAHLEDRLDAIVRAQALADQYGHVDLHTLLADELVQYGALEGERLLLSGPEVQLPPRIGQVLSLAIHELAVNAVEHGALGDSKGKVEVSWSIGGGEEKEILSLSWREHGQVSGRELTSKGFGTEVLTRMLQYELQADTNLTVTGDGLRCVVTFTLPRRAEVAHVSSSA